MDESGNADRPSGPATALLKRWASGDREAFDALMPLVYDELHRAAVGLMKSERRQHTLQPTALVNEVYAKLVDSDVSINDRHHFLSLAAGAMRHVLVDHARARRREKRGGDAVHVTLGDDQALAGSTADYVLDVDDALKKLAEFDERKAKVVELHYFGGMTFDQIADHLGIARITVNRDMRLARAWLRVQMSE